MQVSTSRSACCYTGVPAALGILTSVFFLATVSGYGYFRDELYYLACGRHLDWGYVDHPPLVGWIAALVRVVLGESLLALRCLPALAAGATVWLAGLMARELGGGRFAQALAGLATFFAPVYLSLFSYFSMNAFDVLLWALGGWLAIRLLAGADPRLWLVFGAVAGIGLENKVSFLFFGFGLAAGLVLARRFDVLRNPWLWAGGALAGVLFLPHLLWQQAHGWPTLEFMANAREHKNVALSASDFLVEQLLQMGPASAPVWLSGLVFLLASRLAAPWRTLGWAYLAVLATMLVLGNAKAYYLAPAYTVLFAAGGAAIESFSVRRAPWLRPVAVTLLVLLSVPLMPFGKPLLPVETYVRYAAALGVVPESGERHEIGRLPQQFADMHGWPELAAAVAEVYRKLSPAEQAIVCIFGQNYGQAGAIDLFGPAHGLPPAISGHNSYFLWGPRECTGEVMIVLGDHRQRLEELFRSVELGTVYTCKDCMPYENGKSIWIARGLAGPLPELWPQIKNFN